MARMASGGKHPCVVHPSDLVRMARSVGYLSVSATGVWGPLSRKALRTFKSDRDLTADEIWDKATERRLFGGDAEQAEAFIGIWGIDASACSPRRNRKDFLPAVIDGEGAWAGETFCTLRGRSTLRQDGTSLQNAPTDMNVRPQMFV